MLRCVNGNSAGSYPLELAENNLVGPAARSDRLKFYKSSLRKRNLPDMLNAFEIEPSRLEDGVLCSVTREARAQWARWLSGPGMMIPTVRVLIG